MRLLSGYETCKCAADFTDCDVYTSTFFDSGSRAGNPVLTFYTGRFAGNPGTYRADGTVQVEISESTGYGTLAYEVFPESERELHDLSSFALRVGSAYYLTWASGYAAVPADGTLTVNRDLTDFSGTVEIAKSMTLDLDGHLFTQASGGNFVRVKSGVILTITGGGTIRVVGSSVVCLNPLEGATVNVRDCTFEGFALVWGGGTVNFLSEDSVCDTTSFVSSGGSATVNVSNGVVRSSKIWDGSDTGASGTQVNAAGGAWKVDPLTKVGKAKFALADGLVTRQDEEDGLYNVVSLDTTLAVDPSSDIVPVFRGTAPAGGATVTVAFTVLDEWTGRKKLVADYSNLENADKLSLSVASTPAEYGTTFRATLEGGKLYARIVNGMVLVFR